ncbi:MAG: peroxiredoxin, partial [Campylobacterales bacterium]
FGEVCPAGWTKGDEGMKPTADGVAEYLAGHEKEL